MADGGKGLYYKSWFTPSHVIWCAYLRLQDKQSADSTIQTFVGEGYALKLRRCIIQNSVNRFQEVHLLIYIIKRSETIISIKLL